MNAPTIEEFIEQDLQPFLNELANEGKKQGLPQKFVKKIADKNNYTMEIGPSNDLRYIYGEYIDTDHKGIEATFSYDEAQNGEAERIFNYTHETKTVIAM